MIRCIEVFSAVAISVTFTTMIDAGSKRTQENKCPCPQVAIHDTAQENGKDLTSRMILISTPGVPLPDKGKVDDSHDEMLEEGFRKTAQTLGAKDEAEWSFVFDQILGWETLTEKRLIVYGTIFRCGDGPTRRETRAIDLGVIQVKFTRVTARHVAASYGVVTRIAIDGGDVRSSSKTVFYIGGRRWK